MVGGPGLIKHNRGIHVLCAWKMLHDKIAPTPQATSPIQYTSKKQEPLTPSHSWWILPALELSELPYRSLDYLWIQQLVIPP